MHVKKQNILFQNASEEEKIALRESYPQLHLKKIELTHNGNYSSIM